MTITGLREAFGDREFTPKEAAMVLGIDDPSPYLRRWKTLGLVKRIGRGQYRLASPEDAVRVAKYRRAAVRELLLFGPVDVALDGPDAVSAWTKGRYRAGTVPGQEVVYLAVAADREEAFRGFADDVGVAVGTDEDWPRGAGVKVILRVVDELEPVLTEAGPAVPLEEVRALVASNPTAYEGAEEWLPA